MRRVRRAAGLLNPSTRRPRTLACHSVLTGALLGVLAAGCAHPGPGPVGWPAPAEAAARALAQPELPDPALEAALDAFESRTTESITARLPEREGRRVDREYRRAARKIRRAGARLGILAARTNREEGEDLHTALVVYERRKRLTQLVFQWSLQEDGDFSTLTIRRQPWPAEIGTIAADYVSVNRFRFPLVGTWDVLQGGRTIDVNKHYPHPQQRWAYDLIIRRDGAVREQGPNVNERHYAYGGTIVSPAPGTIIFARDGVRDNPVGTRGQLGGNGVVIDHGFGEYTAHWHMIPGTVTVKVGDQVSQGQELGKVGNSGRSTLAHLHVHLVSAGPGQSPQALPLEFHEVIVDGVPMRRGIPVRGQKVRHRADGDLPSEPDPRAMFDL